MKELTKAERISKEDKRLREIYKDMPKDVKSLYDGLIKRAAYMRIALEDYEEDILAKGSVEPFSQSSNMSPYDRERPVTRLYNTMNKNYQSIMKQLNDSLPEEKASDAETDIMKFAIGARK